MLEGRDGAKNHLLRIYIIAPEFPNSRFRRNQSKCAGTGFCILGRGRGKENAFMQGNSEQQLSSNRAASLRQCSGKTEHRGEFRQHAISRATAKPEGFEVNVLAAYTRNEVAKVLLDSSGSYRVNGGIENLE